MQVALLAFALLVIVAPLLLGGVPAWATIATAALAAFAAWTALLATRDSVDVRASSPVGAVLVLAVLWTTIQAIPLPCGVVDAVAPRSAETARGASDLIGGGVPCTISMDRGATREAILRASAIASAFAAAWLLSVAGNRKRVVDAVIASVLLLAAIALGHLVVDADRVFGIYDPIYAPTARYGPVLNPNHLAGLMTLGAPLLIARAARADSAARWVWWVAVATVLAVGILTLSRAGVTALALGTVATLALVWRGTARGRARPAVVLALGVAAAAGLAGGAFAMLPDVVHEATTSDLRKLDLVARALEWSIGTPWVGVGRGAFSSAFVADVGGNRRWTHAENVLAQSVAEWGLPFAVLMLGVIAVAVTRNVANARSLMQRAAGIAVLALAAQNLLDFGLEVTGPATVAAATLGAALAPESAAPGSQRPYDAGDRTSLVGVILATLGLLTLAPVVLRDDAQEMQTALQRHLVARDHAAFGRVLPRAISTHPAEPAFALLAGVEARIRGERASLRWLNRAMALAPHWSAPHVEAARYLRDAGRTDQALLELREAAARNGEDAPSVTCSLIRREPRPEYVLRSAPTGPNRAAYVEAVSACFPQSSPDAEALDRSLLDEIPELRGARIRQARRAGDAGRSAEARSALETLLREDPTDVAAHLAMSRVISSDGDHTEAAAHLAAALDRSGEQRDLLQALAEEQQHAGDRTGMHQTLIRMRGLAGGNPRELAQVERLSARLERASGDDLAALEALERAHGYVPDAATLRSIIALAEGRGDRVRALRAQIELCRLDPADEEACAAREELRTGRRPPRERSPAPGQPNPAARLTGARE